MSLDNFDDFFTNGPATDNDYYDSCDNREHCFDVTNNGGTTLTLSSSCSFPILGNTTSVTLLKFIIKTNIKTHLSEKLCVQNEMEYHYIGMILACGPRATVGTIIWTMTCTA